MLERQQAQPKPDDSDRHPLVHDILATIGLSKAKSGGSEKVETLNHAAESYKSDYDASTQGSNSAAEAHNQHDDDIDQCKSPILSCDDTTLVFPPRNWFSPITLRLQACHRRR